jgi:hypothetical protein
MNNFSAVLRSLNQKRVGTKRDNSEGLANGQKIFFLRARLRTSWEDLVEGLQE